MTCKKTTPCCRGRARPAGSSKHLLFDLAAKDIREGGLRLHDETTFWQLTAIDGATPGCAPGQHDGTGPGLGARDPAGGRDQVGRRKGAKSG